MLSVTFRARGSLALALALAASIAALCFAARSQAADTIYWNNYQAKPASIGFANPDGTGGGALNASPIALQGTEGNAYDTVTNRFFVANYYNDKIVAINLDGSGAADFTAPGAVVSEPEGLVIDPESRMVYWINSDLKTISFARLDGSSGGVLDTAGAAVDAYRLSIDPVAKRLYWFDGTVGNVVSVSTAGGTVTALNTTGAKASTSSNGIAVEPGLGKVFWISSDGEAISWASLAGTGGGDFPISAPAIEGAYGLAVDAAANRIYWANYGTGEDRTNGLGSLPLGGEAAPINVLTAPLKGPQDPVLIKVPAATAPPAITRGKGAKKSELTCSTGTWNQDAAGAFVYQAPRSFTYAWKLGGKPVAGATAATLNATKPGKYACEVTAVNQVGSATASSAMVSLKASKLQLVVKSKTAKAPVGGKATLKVQAVGQGDVKSKSSRVCVQLTKAQKQVLTQPKCKQVGKLAPTKRKTVKLKVGVKPGAAGTYSVKLVTKGTGGKAAKVKIQIK